MSASSPPPSDDAALVQVLTRLEVKLDTSLARGDDHELRLRVVESRKTVSPRDLWAGIGTAIAAGAALASIIRAIFPN